MEDTLAELRRQEVWLGAKLAEARAAGDAATATELGRAHLQTAEQRRKVEKDLARIQKDRGDALPRVEVERAWVEVMLAVRNDLLALPASLAPRLVGLKTAAEVATVLESGLRDSVRHIADRMQA